MAEVRVQAEGILRWVRASGSGTTWATASAPASGTVGFVRSFSFTSAANMVAVSDRGTPTHNKWVAANAITFTFQFAWTGTIPTAVTGSGASVPMFHFEYRANEGENGNSGRYYQFYGVPVQSLQFTESQNENTLQFQSMALAMSGANNTGYLG